MLSSMVKTLLINQHNNDIKAYEKIQKIATAQGGEYTTGCLSDYPYFKKLQADCSRSKQKGLDEDPRVIHQMNFTGNYRA